MLIAQVFNTVQSFHSDSALAFALFLNNLPDLQSRLQPAQLLAAIEVRIRSQTLRAAAADILYHCRIALHGMH